ncbi:histidine phosphatase family protein, partial [Solemya elarraichensis gill symbiont]
MKETIIDLILHGEPVGGSRYRGHGIDDPLSEKGWQQMWESVGEHSDWSRIISSPLLRCADFAKQLGESRKLPVTINDNLKEIGFGTWEGKTKAQLREERLVEFDAFYRDPVANTPENAENVMDFHTRIGAVFEDLR